MSKRLPPKANLEHLKKQAKDLLRAHRDGEPQACKRIGECLSRLSRTSEEEIRAVEVSLQEAQHVIAREYGFAGWSKLLEEVQVEEVGTPPVSAAAWHASGSSPEHYEMGGDPTSDASGGEGFIRSKPTVTSQNFGRRIAGT